MCYHASIDMHCNVQYCMIGYSSCYMMRALSNDIQYAILHELDRSHTMCIGIEYIDATGYMPYAYALSLYYYMLCDWIVSLWITNSFILHVWTWKPQIVCAGPWDRWLRMFYKNIASYCIDGDKLTVPLTFVVIFCASCLTFHTFILKTPNVVRCDILHAWHVHGWCLALGCFLCEWFSYTHVLGIVLMLVVASRVGSCQATPPLDPLGTLLLNI